MAKKKITLKNDSGDFLLPRTDISVVEGIEAKQDVIDSSHKLDYSLIANTPTVDTTYDATSNNAQSGTAVAGALNNYATQTDLQQGLATKETVGVAYTKEETNALLNNKLDATKCTFQTTAPTSAISDGGVHIVYLSADPTTKYSGYIYLIAE